jgi:hypothetical protein
VPRYGTWQPDGSLWRVRRPPSARVARSLWWILKWLAFPALALFLILTGATRIGPAAAAAQGHGTRGYFVPTQVSCGHGCTWRGDFMLPGGQITRKGVSLDNPHGPLRRGEPVAALDTGEQGTVFPPHGGRLWILLLIEIVAGTVIAGLWAWRVPLRARRRRRRLGFAGTEVLTGTVIGSPGHRDR